MIKLLILLLLPCLLLTPLAGAADEVHSITLSPTLAIETSAETDWDPESFASLGEYVATLRIETAFTLHDSGPYLLARLYAGETDLGFIEYYMNNEAFYLRSSALPSGWLSFDMEYVAEALSLEADTTPEALPSAYTSVAQVFSALGDAMDTWYQEQDESLIYPKNAADLPRPYAPNQPNRWETIHIGTEDILDILRETDQGLRTLAQERRLVDFDGLTVSSLEYEWSYVGQVMTELLETAESSAPVLSAESITASGNDFSESSIGLILDDGNSMVTGSLRVYPWAQDGTSFSADLSHNYRGTYLSGVHLLGQFLPETGRYTIHAMGSSDFWSVPDFDATFCAQLPNREGQSRILSSTLSLSLGEAGDQGYLYTSLDIDHNTEHSIYGGNDDISASLNLDLSVLVDSDYVLIQNGYNLLYQRNEQQWETPDLSDIRLHVDATTTQEAYTAYENLAIITFSQWMMKGLSTLPGPLMQKMMDVMEISF